MVAAYAFALQALLGAVLVSQAAAAGSDPFVICYASGCRQYHLFHPFPQRTFVLSGKFQL
jgi:hypothetical protein